MDPKQWLYYDYGSRIIDLNKLNLMDDVALSVALEDNPKMAKAILAPILNRSDFEIESAKTQVRSGMVKGHFVVFDCVIVFHDGTKVNLEMQKARKDMPLERMIYNRAMLRVGYALGPGERYEDMRPTIVVVILNGDFFGRGFPLYRLTTALCADPYEDVEPNQGIYIVNSNNKDATTELGRLMRDISATDPTQIKDPALSSTLEMLKSNKGVNLMSEYWQEVKESVFKEMRENIIRELRESIATELRESITKEIQEEERARTYVSLYLDGTIDAEVAKGKLGLSEEEFQAAVESFRDNHKSN